jgi:hypothetical protein
MTDVEQPRALPYRVMFIQDARVLNGHVISRKWDHFGSKSHMAVVKGRAFQIDGISHGRIGLRIGQNEIASI